MIFVDTSFWIALRNRRDSHHGEAVDLLRKHADGALLTSNRLQGAPSLEDPNLGHSRSLSLLQEGWWQL